MKYLTSAQVRQMWLDFFKTKGHAIEPGAPLVPHNDPTLLWINSGVAALKKYFDGSEKPASQRITNAQKSIRTNDIENVGMTARHHTFFEMLGNFSIGDYFREEAIKWGWELLTTPEWFGFKKEELYITYHPTDLVTKQMWMDLGVEESHLIKCEGNFWEIGEGPCGPNTEIFVDRGVKYDPENIGIRLLEEDMDNDRYIEIWNIVFSQYNAKEGLERSQYPELPQKNIDTGAGLERLVCIFQEAETNFDTDLFMPIIRSVEQEAAYKYEGEHKKSYRVIADHIRTCTFAIADGAVFSNEGRGYVLRRLLRRAVRYGKKLGINKSFMYKLVSVTANNMKDYYPYLLEKIEYVEKLIKAEEERFHQTLTAGEQMLLNHLSENTTKEITGEVAFKLYDTYGFPYELTVEIAEEKGFTVNKADFDKEMQLQKERARNARDDGQSMKRQSKDLLDFELKSEFTYECKDIKAKVIAIFKDGVKVDETCEKCEVVFDTTNFYAESGGQVADKGYIEGENFYANVLDVQKAPRKQHLHFIEVERGMLQVGDEVTLSINKGLRKNIEKNHSACHLLQKALQEVLGNHVAQAGSYVDGERLRFDFSHFEKISAENLQLIERKVNEAISKSLDTDISYMEIEEAKKSGATALFSEKYDNIVRVVNFGGYSVELCGGCHVANTSEVGCFAIEFEESISSGVRRIQATTGIHAYELFKKRESILSEVGSMLGALSYFEIKDRLHTVLNTAAESKKTIEQLKGKLASYEVNNVIETADTSLGYPVIITTQENLDKDSVNMFVDNIKSRLKEFFVFLVNKQEDKVGILAACSQNLVKEKGINCGMIIKEAANILGGKGGGRPDMAQAGGKDASKIEDAIAFVKSNLK